MKIETYSFSLPTHKGFFMWLNCPINRLSNFSIHLKLIKHCYRIKSN